MNDKSLWGSLPSGSSIVTPLSILREQASILGKETQNLLEGDVSVSTSRDRRKFEVALSIVAPPLDGYRYGILLASHGILPFPCHVTDYGDGGIYECESEEKLKEMLSDILQSDRVHRAIASLLAQIDAAKGLAPF